ncbi:hypothetical protein TNCV_4177851 [Trichonephila clavipes]|nr:hypothetical protein TNCV_4177851 [Trichonephila clavipes]
MWNVTNWQQVVFRDESRFVLWTHVNRVRVWTTLVSGTIPQTLFYVTLPRTAGIIVWAPIAYDSRSTLIVMRGTLTVQRYVDD